MYDDGSEQQVLFSFARCIFAQFAMLLRLGQTFDRKKQLFSLFTMLTLPCRPIATRQLFFCWLQMSLKMTKKSSMKFLLLRYTFSLVYTFWRLLQLNLIFRCSNCNTARQFPIWNVTNYYLNCTANNVNFAYLQSAAVGLFSRHTANNTNENLNGKIFYRPTKRCIFAFCHIVGG